jgi:hypothetical protein
LCKIQGSSKKSSNTRRVYRKLAQHRSGAFNPDYAAVEQQRLPGCGSWLKHLDTDAPSPLQQDSVESITGNLIPSPRAARIAAERLRHWLSTPNDVLPAMANFS